MSKVKRKNEFVGEVGERRTFNVTVFRVVSRTKRISDHEERTTGVHMLNDDEGRSLTWFASIESDRWLTVGQTYRIKATVDRHQVYREYRQTVIKRVKVIPDDPNEIEF